MIVRSRPFIAWFTATFLLTSAGAASAYHTQFVADNCNYAAPTATS